MSDNKRPCDRCGFGRKGWAVKTRQFQVDGEDYWLHLCEYHNNMFDQDLYGWANLASGEPPVPVFAPIPPPTVRPGQGNGTAEIRAIQARAQELAEQQRAAAEEENRRRRRAAEWVARRQAQPIPDVWTLSIHGVKRHGQRGLSEEEILRAAQFPELAYRGDPRLDPNVWCHRRGRCVAIVNRETHEITSVINRDRPTDDEQPRGREKAAWPA